MFNRKTPGALLEGAICSLPSHRIPPISAQLATMGCYCCRSAIVDALRGICVLVALGGLSCGLLGLHALLPLGATALDVNVAWFAYVLIVTGALLLLLGLAASTGPWCRLSAPLHCVSPAGCGARSRTRASVTCWVVVAAAAAAHFRCFAGWPAGTHLGCTTLPSARLGDMNAIVHGCTGRIAPLQAAASQPR